MTTPVRWERLEALFDAAIDVPDAERAAWLAQACPEDPALRDEVARMLDAHRRTGGLLDRPIATVSAAAMPLADRVAAALDGRYVLEEEIGRGGQAAVFLAKERKHDRRVVIKVLKPDVAAWHGTERFVREVAIAARLAHPHIVPLLDSGDADGLLYFVMPHVEGETLRVRLESRGPLPARAALPLLRDVASGLAHAHRAGIVHRDLKPENVLVAGDHAYLLDFGIAKLLAAADPTAPPAPHLTGEHAVGTPAYMAPEQWERSRALDARADVYAWGVLAHETLTGTLPAPGVRTQLTTGAPAAAIPHAVAELVDACLAVEPDARVPDAPALLARLDELTASHASVGRGPAASRARRARRWSAVMGALGIVGAVAAVGARRLRPAPAPTLGGPGAPVAVLALTNETADPSLDVIGRMAGDWMTQGLQESGLLSVVPWPTSRIASERLQTERARGNARDPIAFVREQTGAQTIVGGSYYLAGDSLRLRAEIIDARTGQVVTALPPLSAPRDSALAAVRALRDRLMGSFAVSRDERVAAPADLRRHPPTFAAYRAFDRGLQQFLAQEYDSAAVTFREAYAMDTSFVVALVYAASAHWNGGEWAPAESTVAAALQRRTALGPYHEAWAAFLDARLGGDGARALEAIRRAATLAPGPRAWYEFAHTALEGDRAREALDALTRIDPDAGGIREWSSYWTQLAHARHLLGEHGEELAAARAMRARFPERRVGVVLEARALAALGRDAEIAELIDGQRGQSPTTYWSQGAAMVVAGEELQAHGRAAQGRAWLRRGVGWLRTELAVHPGDRAHRYWLGSALYDLGEWRDASHVLGALARDFPDRVQYRGLAAVAAARAGVPVAERLLGTPEPRDRGEDLAFRARLAAIRGEPTRAASLFADAARAGVTGLAWLHASAYPDLLLTVSVRADMPAALRVSVR